MRRIPLLFSVVILFGCAQSGTLRESASSEDVTAEPQFAMAKLFDDLMHARLNSDQAKQLETNCREYPQASVFCFSILNRQRLTDAFKEMEKDAQPVKYRGRTFRPRFGAKNAVLNWEELRNAPVQGLLRGMPKGQTAKLNALKLAALRETDCPNTPAIAIASSLEDKLPTTVTFNEVARLYEKGASCMDEKDSERELVLTRAGLFYYAAKEYRLALDVLKKSSEHPTAFVGRPLYWLYRAQLQLDETSAAKRTLKQLQNRYPFSFHSLVAQTASGRDPGELLAKASVSSIKRSKQGPEVNQLLETVEILRRLSFDSSAAQVLNWAIAQSRGGIEPEVMLYMAELKKDQGDYKSKITILSGILYQNPDFISRQTLELYFPKVLFPIFEKQSAAIDPYFLLAIARRESAFDANAVSSADARGLLQVLPATGRRMRRKRSNLFDPETNIAVGAKYVVELLKRTDGQVHLALAAYNAGPGKLKGWSRSYPTDDPILFTDLIPFRETREYVGSVLRNYYWYRRIHQSDTPIPADKILALAIAEKQE